MAWTKNRLLATAYLPFIHLGCHILEEQRPVIVYTLLFSCIYCWWRCEALQHANERVWRGRSTPVLGQLWRSLHVCVCVTKFQHFISSMTSGVMTCATLHVNSWAIHLQVNLQRAIPMLAWRQRCVFMTRWGTSSPRPSSSLSPYPPL